MKHFDPRGNQKKSLLVIIDGQVDFTDRPGSALPVPGGVAALLRSAELIRQSPCLFDAILVTRDKHSPDHIAHAVRWVDRAGNPPPDYTTITLADVDTGEYRAANPAEQLQQRNYVAELEARREKPLMIWPPHCLAGTPGYELDPELVSAIAYWEQVTGHKAVYQDKGQHRNTEQYSATAAAVPIPGAPETFMNMPLVNWVNSFGKVYWTGLALSHCVMATMVHVFGEMVSQSLAAHTLFLDCTASVPGFESDTEAWLRVVRAQGLRTLSSLEMI